MAQFRLRRAVQAARMIVWECDLQNGLVSHELPASLFGAIDSPLPLRRALRLIRRQDRRELAAPLRSALTRGEPFIKHCGVTFSPAGQLLWMELHASVVCDQAGVALRLEGVLLDITAHKQAVDTLADADRRKDTFLATLAHELRNPLSAIMTAARLLDRAELEETQIRACGDVVRRQSQRLARVIDDLLDISRIVQDRLELRPERIDARHALRAALEAADPLIRSRGHEVHAEWAREPLWTNADEARLAQAFENVIANAAKYTPPSGRISVLAERAGPCVTVRILDTGIGISEQDLPHVFDPFYQAEASRGHAHGGLGIGLALVRRIVQLHGGTVEAHSAGPGRGSEMVIRLPALDTGDTRRNGTRARALPAAEAPQPAKTANRGGAVESRVGRLNSTRDAVQARCGG